MGALEMMLTLGFVLPIIVLSGAFICCAGYMQLMDEQKVHE